MKGNPKVAASVSAALLIAGCWLYLVLFRPNVQWSAGIPSDLGVLPWICNGLAFLVLLGTLVREFGRGEWAVFALGIATNVTGGWIMDKLPEVPLYLDSVGCVLVGYLLGPRAGAATALGGALFWGLDHDVAVVYAVVNVVVGWMAGMFMRLGGFTNLFTVIVSGLVTGVTAAMVSSPLTIYVRGNFSGNPETTALEVMRELNESILGSFAFLLQLGDPLSYSPGASDPLDKALVFSLVFLIAPCIAKTFQNRNLKDEFF